MSKSKDQVKVVIECTPDSETRHKYLGTITFVDPNRSINAPFTFTALLEGGDLHLEFFVRDTPVFQFHQDQPVAGQLKLVEDENEATFRMALIQTALDGVEGSGQMAGIFYSESGPSGDDVYTQLASLIAYHSEHKLNLTGMSEEVREYVLRRLQEAS